MPLTRRALLTSLGAVAPLAYAGCRNQPRPSDDAAGVTPLVAPDGSPDWTAVRALFPLAPDLVHLASFLLVSHPRPVADAIDTFRRKLDADPTWLEAAALSDAEGRPFAAIKQRLADYTGGAPEDICLTSNTTTALAVVYHGLRIRSDQHILTTAHDHYSHHESIRYAAERSGAAVRRVALYDRPADADADEMVGRLSRAIDARTRAVGVTWVHSSTGVRLPLDRIATTIERANRGRDDGDRCLLIVDGVHGFGNQDVDIARTGCDFFAAGTHKWLLAPRGTGLLWGRPDAWPALRPVVPSFDPDAVGDTWPAWMNGTTLTPTRAAHMSPGGFLAYEYFLAIPAAVDLHQAIGRGRIAQRIAALNSGFREGVTSIPGVTLHTPVNPGIAGGLSCFEIAGLSAEVVTARLADRRIRTNPSPYKASYARVAAGMMNSFDDIETTLRAIREIAAA